MRFYAHTAEDERGNRLPDCSSKWQLLSTYLPNVVDKIKEFAALLGLATEAELAGLLHDL